ncbi:ATP-binding protein, partial [Patescibacteria group bacterium]|nr:ATP-binding protein [Patescibacteria group bacterium]
MSPKKLKTSLLKSGASREVVEVIAQKIESELTDGMKTKDIYRKAFSMLLKKKENIPAAKYSVRRAVMDLGPNGFPFEDFVGEIYRAKGYSVEVGKNVKGACVMHEIDVVAQNKNEIVMIEIKFHNNL